MSEEDTHAKLTQRFSQILRKAEDLGISPDSLSRLPSVQSLRAPRTGTSTTTWWGKLLNYLPKILVTWAVLQTALLAVWVVQWPVSRAGMVQLWYRIQGANYETEPCIVGLHDVLLDLTRPPVYCGICSDLGSEVDRVSKLTPEEFELNYAYSGRPVVIVDGAKNWTATKYFSFEFFKNIYPEDSPVLLNVEQHCQFFPYKTNFQTLGEVFNMSEDRAHMADGSEPWYVGWSNCDSSATNILRTHYERPYFLPTVAESSKTDWIFMGSPGYGAHMHIDNVGNPSWQAQITGTKLWTLEPPPECYHECVEQIEVTVHPGEIIVLDTNQWYHSTLIMGEEMSITIGSEYD